MIAVMANYLGYDIYDFELTKVHSNSELRKLLMKTRSKSIIMKVQQGVRECGREKDGGAAEEEVEEQEKKTLDSPSAEEKDGAGRGEFSCEEDSVGDDCEKD